MNADRSNPLFQTAEELAGVHHKEMMRGKEATLAFLAAPDYRVRLAAILVGETTWNCGRDSRVVEACHHIAESDADDSIRIFAIHSLGTAFSGTKASDASLFLANMVLDAKNTVAVQRDAYWALREIQFGVGDVDFDTFLKGTICVANSIMRAFPGRFLEDDFRRNVTPQPGFPEGFWDSAEDIEWDFVHNFAST